MRCARFGTCTRSSQAETLLEPADRPVRLQRVGAWPGRANLSSVGDGGPCVMWLGCCGALAGRPRARAPHMLEQCPTTGGGETTDEDDEADNTAPALRGKYVGLSGVRSNGTAVLDFSKHQPVSELCPINPNAMEARVAATGGRTYTQSRLVFGVCACTQHPPLTTNPHH